MLLTALSGQFLFWCVLVGSAVAFSLIVPGGELVQLAPSTVAAVFLAATVFIVRFSTTWVRIKLVHRRLDSVSLINNLLRVVGGVVFTYVLLGLLGLNVSHFVAFLAGSSVGITLALRDRLAHLFSGMLIVVSNKIQPGDYVRLTSGQEGYVIDIRWADTYIREPSNNIDSAGEPYVRVARRAKAETRGGVRCGSPTQAMSRTMLMATAIRMC